jgi:uncharacterized protein
MTKETAENSIKFIKTKVDELNLNKIKIVLHGGEPFLNFSIVKFIVNQLKADKSMKDKLTFSITTNGTILNDEIVSFIKENTNISLSISIDGLKEEHDLYRKFKNGEGSFEKVYKNFKILIKNKIYPRIRMTVTKNTVDKIFESYKFFYEKGAKSIVFIQDSSDENWDLAGIESYYNNLKKVIEYLLKNDEMLGKLFLKNLKDSIFRKRIICTGGTETFHIDFNGKIYPCSYSLGEAVYELGHIDTGIDKGKLNKLEEINSKKNIVCNGCKVYNFCESSICKIVNKHLTGDYYTPSAVFCRINHKKIKVLREFKVI